MTQMRAAVLVEPGKFALETRPAPAPGPDEALIRVERVGVCGTDLHIFHGRYARERLPLVPGHEFTGTVAALGSAAAGAARGLEIGMRVVVDMNIGCGHCYWCRRNEVLNCPEVRQLGIHVDGAFRDYVALPARLVIPAPDDADPALLSLTEPLACVVRAAKKANARFGQSAVVLGAGPIGHLHAQLLRAIGLAPIIVAEPDAERAALAERHGADIVVRDPAALEDAVLGATEGRGADLVIESVGKVTLYQRAAKLARKGGHVAAFGITAPGETLALDILSTVLHENSIKGSVAGMGEDMREALTLLVHGRIDPTPFFGIERPLEAIQDAFEEIDAGPPGLKTQIVMDAA